MLVGDSASRFTLAANDAPVPVPAIPLEVPSLLLQRRPDVAAAERRTAAANARVGVARSAYFPQLTLDGQGGWQSDRWGSIATAPNRFWSIGPTLLLNVFDGGRRKAAVEAAKAATDEAGAQYRGVALAAFAQVEDNLTLLRDLGTALVDQRAAADAAQRSVDLSLNRYREGAVGYLDVVQAQTAALDARRSVIDGPFAETRELIAGFWLWQVRSMDEAVEWLKRAPFNTDGRTPVEVEIRPFFEAEDFGEAFTPELRAQEQRLRDRIEHND